MNQLILVILGFLVITIGILVWYVVKVIRSFRDVIKKTKQLSGRLDELKGTLQIVMKQFH